MIKCNICGYMNDDDSLFCEECGNKLANKKVISVSDTLFCGQCGAKVLPGSRFCEECGAPVEYKEGKSEFSTHETGHVFDSKNWAEKWERLTCSKTEEFYGLIIINTVNVPDCSSFMETLFDYIFWSANNRNVFYEIFDIGKQKVVPTINNEYELVMALKEITKFSRPHFQLIIGDCSSVPYFDFENYCSDGDETVPSDLPFCTLKAKNLFEGMENFSLNGFIPTGRIPASASDGFSLATDYFVNVMSSYDKQFSGPVLGVSALVWSDESNAIYSRLSPGAVLESPPVSKEESVRNLANTNAPGILYFNLHGSDETKYWYGQEDWVYPEAVSPWSFLGLEPGYVIGVEACYGAAYEGRTDSDSIVKTALKNGCTAMLGSSMIAYGRPEEPGSCADIIVGKFLLSIRNGKSVGDSYIDGISALINSDMDDTEIKTLQEFALYGDPSLGASLTYRAGIQNSLITIQVPDIRFETNKVLSDVNDKIAKALSKQISKYVYGKYKVFNHVEPEIIGGNGKFQSVYRIKQNSLKHVLKVYYNSDGKVTKELISK